jgi:5-formyltetrahydrofolate cyclo-ligase
VKALLAAENLMSVLDDLVGAGMRLSALVYLSYSSELSTEPLIDKLLERGVAIYAPRVEGEEMVAVEYGDDFVISGQGIREPIGERFDGDLDIVILPLLAVDEQGNRLGYGGGYYDRYLAKHTSSLKIGYCFDFQMSKSLPSEETDVALNMVVTDTFTKRIK